MGTDGSVRVCGVCVRGCVRGCGDLSVEFSGSWVVVLLKDLDVLARVG